jgi:hypothetical protein
MQKIYVGIDLSLTSTAIAISTTDNPNPKYFAFPSKTSFSKSKNWDWKSNELLVDISRYVDLFFINRHTLSKDDNINVRNMNHLWNCESLTNLIIKTIKDYVGDYTPEDIVWHIAIEHYSYGSTGDASYQIAELGGILKHKLMTMAIPNFNMTFHPGPSLKKIAGSGNLDKWGMMQSFINEQEPKGCPFATYLKNNSDNVVVPRSKTVKRRVPKSRKYEKVKVDYLMVKKPIDDVVDAYWVLRGAQEADTF